MYLSKGLRASTAVALVAALLALQGCAKDGRTTGSVSARNSSSLSQMSMPQLNELTRQYSEKYERNPKDKANGLSFASLLRMTGRDEQALAVMRKLVIFHPKDNDVLSAYGKALAATGNFKEALGVIQRAQKPENPDWKLLSAEGAILDQLEQPDAAREKYRQALDMAPREPSILSNLGMSYLLTNDLPSAETYLRKANSMQGADSRVRQNLALVIGLQGRFDEAEKVASAELPAEDAEANIAYLRQMLSQQNAWNQIKSEDKQAQ
ncbi:MAG: tetratricopeptide repeat protein [Rhizobiaceae bacterium]